MSGLRSLLTETPEYLTTESGLAIFLEGTILGPTAPDRRFILVEIEAYKPGGVTLTLDQGHGTHPHGTLAQLGGALEATDTIRASDIGYRTAPADVGGPVPYPPLLSDALQIDNKVYLEGPQAAVSAAWGNAVLANPDRYYDSIPASWNSDARPVRILTGLKTWDRWRQYYVDPPYDSLTLMFAGRARPWFLSETALTIPLRDASYWLDRAYQTATYGGTGGYDGTVALTGKPIPRTRGGTALYPVLNVTPTLVDPVNRIYQYNDARGTVVALYEGGALTITFQSDTTNLYSGTTTPGQYRTDNSRGLFQLGSPPAPAYAITADVTGQFPVAGAITTTAAIARYMMTEDMLLPLASIDLASFTVAAIAYPYVAGMYFDSSASPSGIDVISVMLGGFGARLIARRDGTLAAFVLRALTGSEMPATTLDASNLASLVSRQLPASLDPPPSRSRYQYARNYTIQTSGLNTATATAAHIQAIAQAGQVAARSSSPVLIAYRNPNDRGPISGALLKESDAQAVADADLALWGVRRRIYDASVPTELAMDLDIGDVVSLRYAMDDLLSGRLGRIIGYQFKPSETSATFQLLV